jgi:hypothetical protein
MAIKLISYSYFILLAHSYFLHQYYQKYCYSLCLHALEPGDMNIPGWDFHPLKGKLKRYGVSVSGVQPILLAIDSIAAHWELC